MTSVPEEPGGGRPASLVSHLQELARVLASRDADDSAGAHDVRETALERQKLLERIEATSATPMGNLRSLGRAKKVSVSLPEGLTAVVQQRVGKGEFSHYVAEAVARQLELDLLAELAALLDAEHGPIPEELLAEAGAAWPDVE